MGSASESQLCNTATCPVTPGAKNGLLVFLFVSLSVCLSICPFVCLSNPTSLNTTYQSYFKTSTFFIVKLTATGELGRHGVHAVELAEVGPSLDLDFATIQLRPMGV